MNKSQENKLSMYIFVEKTCNDFKSDWANLNAFAAAKKSLDKTINSIKRTRQLQVLQSKGTTQKRYDVADRLISNTMKCISVLQVYATITDNKELLEQISYSRSDLTHSRDTVLYDICMLVYNNSVSLFDKTIDYGMDAEILEGLKESIHLYDSLFCKSKAIMQKKRYATKTIALLFEEGDAILKKQLDKLILLFKESHPDFYDAYMSARKIKHLGLRHKSNTDLDIDQAA